MANQITVFLDPSLMPAQGQPQATLDANVAQFFSNLPTFGAQFNAGVANLNASLNGAGISIPYTIDLSSIADSDPGSGKLRFSSATQNAATVLRLDLLSSNTADYTAVLDTFDASTSTIKGRIALVKQGDAKTFLIFDVTARAAPTGYRNLSVTPVASSSTNPFGAGEAVLLYFQRCGDKGDNGIFTSAKFSDRKAQGASGGDSPSAAITVRTLNTVEFNTIAGASLSGNQITLPAGTYDFAARCPAVATTQHRAYLRNVNTGSSVQGSNAFSNNGDAVQTDAVVNGRFTIAAVSTFQLHHYTQAAATNGLGLAGSRSGEQEIYSEVTFTKVQ